MSLQEQSFHDTFTHVCACKYANDFSGVKTRGLVLINSENFHRFALNQLKNLFKIEICKFSSNLTKLSKINSKYIQL